MTSSEFPIIDNRMLDGSVVSQNQIKLWGTPHSLFTGKVRAYLLKKQVPFCELIASEPRFINEILPQVGHKVVPVIETAAGEVVQDSTDIVDHLESCIQAPNFIPPGAVQRFVANLLDGFGLHYLLPLAMHYRWTYRNEQELFLRTEFARSLPWMPHSDRLKIVGDYMNRFAGFLPHLGVNEDVIPTMESSYAELLAVLEAHFQKYPYFLGGLPSIADFGMIAPLYAHLARDPVPGHLMKTTAPSVFRWSERMQSAQIIDSDYPNCPQSFFEDDGIPDTLGAILRIVFADWTPGLAADAACFNAWVAGIDHVKPGMMVSRNGTRQIHANVGRVSYLWRGVMINRVSQPQALWHFARAQNVGCGADRLAAQRLSSLLERTGGQEMFALEIKHALDRRDNVLVLA